MRTALLLVLAGMFFSACNDCDEAQDAYCAAWLGPDASSEAVAAATRELELACSYDDNRSFFYAIDQRSACLPDSLR